MLRLRVAPNHGGCMLRFAVIAICACAYSTQTCIADDNAKPPQPFQAPAPQAVAPQAVAPKMTPIFIPPNLPRPGTREVWQYYGVDRRGRWVPRVILAPPTSYYYYNGAPFRYTTTQPSLVMPYIVD